LTQAEFAIAGIENTARFSFRNSEFFGERDLADTSGSARLENPTMIG
jgi:hypothetical protein